MRLYHLKPCMSSQTAWSQRVSLAKRSRSSFAIFVSGLCRFLFLSLSLSLSLSLGNAVGDQQWEAQTLSAGIRVEAC
jgi:hypothetical protein